MSWTIWLFFIIFSFVIVMYFLLEYPKLVDKKNSNSQIENFAHAVSESNGSITRFLLICYISLVVWGIIYLVFNI